MKDIQQKMAKIDEYFQATAPDWTMRERILSRVVKLNEEVGELCEAILCENDPHQRKKEKNIDVDAEIADVIICTLMLAQSRQKDIWDEVTKKLDKQLERFGLSE